MAKKAHPHHVKPYEQKVAQRNAVKRAMRTGGETNSSRKMRPDMPGGQRTPRP
ncbi:MAG: hypothetical protein FWD61_12635 [Phycisphaerales bacterium]|nr:hypothetical protein [Phycisphaerales bacterium]